MPSKTIIIDINTYNRLKAIKQDKSFTEIINDLLDSHATLPLETLGVLSEKANKIEYEEIKNLRRDRDVSL